MLHRIERTALHYDLSIEGAPKHADLQTLAKAVRSLQSACEQGKAVAHRNKGRDVVRLTEVKFYSGGTRAALLLQRSNRDTADPSFSKIVSGETRTEAKRSDEGVAVTAHLLVDLTQQQCPGTYHAILEHVPGLTKSYIEGLFNPVLREFGQYPHVDRNGVFVRAYPKVSLDARLRESLLADVARGRLSYITLMRRDSAGDQFDEDPRVRIRSATIQIEPIEARTGRPVMEFIRWIVKRGRERGYTSARFTYVDESGESKNPSFNIEHADMFDAFVAKASKFKVEQDLAQAVGAIRMDVVKHLNHLLKQHVEGLAA